MKGFRFYRAYESNKLKRLDAESTVIALDVESVSYHGPLSIYGSISGVGSYDIAGMTADRGWLRENCRRISEKQARALMPGLFQYLEG